jgi:large subunit ribosomal protein L4
MTLEAPILSGGAVALDESVFGEERNDALVHEVVKAELAGHRQGTHATRTRGLVRGGRKKPWRQKGTGRARAGTTRAPQWTGGGIAFGPQPRSYAVKVNRKARAKALHVALAAHARAGSLAAFEAESFEAPKTRRAADLLAGWDGVQPLVVVVRSDEEPAARSFQNLARTHVVELSALEVADVVWARSLLISRGALAALQGGEGT